LRPTVPKIETKMLAGNGFGWVDDWISEGKRVVWCAERVNSVQMAERGLVLSEWVSVGSLGQVSRLIDMLASSKWPTDHLKCEMAGEGCVMGVTR